MSYCSIASAMPKGAMNNLGTEKMEEILMFNVLFIVFFVALIASMLFIDGFVSKSLKKFDESTEESDNSQK